jgi:uroporphyrinogen III methyltransferase / synthase
MTGPLRGRRILVTRRPEQSSGLAGALREKGATVIEVPLIAVAPPLDWAPLDVALRRLEGYDWIAFTSANAVRAVAGRVRSLGLTPRFPHGASVGPATTEATHEHLPACAIEMEPLADFRAEGLLAAFPDEAVRGRRFLLPVSDKARDVLADGLTARGAGVERVVVYRTVAPSDAAPALAQALAEGVDAVAFASPSAVDNFIELAPTLGNAVPAAVIGPVTEARARAVGLRVVATAEPSTAEGLAIALVRALGA